MALCRVFLILGMLQYLLFGKRIIIKVLRNHPMAQVKIPSSDKIAEYKEMVYNRHPNLHDVWCTMDGLKITLEQSGDALVQEQYYNGWTHDHYVSSVICFCPDGTIPIVFVNVPGAVHDSQIADYGNIYDKLEFVYESHIEDRQERGVARDATSMRQCAEWGMRAFQSSMPCIKDRMKFETRGERKVTLIMMILLFNTECCERILTAPSA